MSETVATRQRLVAILAADAAGYSRLMNLNEGATVEALDRARTVFRAGIEACHGRVIDMAGDSVLAVFETASGAVNAALAVQSHLESSVSGVPADRRMRFRIGVHMGDVTEKADGTVYGDGVNIAARLQALAEPGGVVVSESVRVAVKGKVSARFDDRGMQALKNLADPVRIFSVDPVESHQGPTQRAASRSNRDRARRAWLFAAALVLATVAVLAGAGKWIPFGGSPAASVTPVELSVAVLPFFSRSTELEPLADSLTRGVTTALVQWHYASVADHGLAVRYMARAFDSRAVTRELQVRYLVAGELDREGNRLRLEARVIDGARANQVWSGTLEVQGSDAGEAERLLVVRLSHRVRAAVDKAERDRSRLAAPPLTARQLTWRGDDAWSQAPNELDGIAVARKFYQQALALDPNFVDAILSEWWALNGEFEGKIDADRGRLVQEMDALSVRAIGIDDNDPAAWDIRTGTLGWLGRWDEALAANSRSRELDPSGLIYSTRRGWLLLSLGKAAEVLTLEEGLIALDPPGSAHMHRHLCQAQLLLGNYAAAIEACQRTGALERWWPDQMILVAAYAQLGNAEKAAMAKTALLAIQPRFTISGYMAKHRSDEPEYLRQMNTHVLPGLRKAGVPE